MKKKIFILDTNIFGNIDRYDFKNGYISKFVNTMRNDPTSDVYLPSIVVEELKKHIQESIENDTKGFKSRYLKESMKVFSKKILDKNIKELEDFIKYNKIKIIDCNKYVDISEINEWYFKKQEPFEPGKEKEFPDAMIISAIIHFLREKNFDKHYIISADRGFRQGIEIHSSYLTYDSVDAALEDILKDDKNNMSKINKESVEKYITSQNILYSVEYIDYNSSDIGLTDIKVEEVKNPVIKIIGIDEEKTSILVNYNIVLSGDIEIPDLYYSMYNKATSTYYHLMYKKIDSISVDDLTIGVDLYKNKDGEYCEYSIFQKSYIDSADVLDYTQQRLFED